MEEKARLLLVDDEPHFCKVMSLHLMDEGYVVDTATSGEKALQRFKEGDYELVITDLKMPGGDGLSLLEGIRKLSSEVPVILLTAFGTVETAVKAMKLGAFDYILKPVDVDQLKIVVSRALKLQRITKENIALKASLCTLYREFSIVAESPAMSKLIPIIRKASQVDTPLLLVGETGVGKELVAKVIHSTSPRSHGPFTLVDCAFLEPQRVEEELFGEGTAKGKIDLADGGTLLLDQVDELSLEVQARLLRFLEEQRVSESPKVRIIATTTKDLNRLVEEDAFRRDLFYRLRVMEIPIPPLRERREDIPHLVSHFIKKYGVRTGVKVEKVSRRAMEILVGHTWPGNVRELENAIESALALCEEGEKVLTERHLPHWLKEGISPKTQPGSLIDMVENLEIEMITQALQECGGNQTKAAERLGITRRMLQYKMKKYEIKPSKLT